MRVFISITMIFGACFVVLIGLLSVVHDLVMQAGGQTMVESMPGQGTTIRLMLPLVGTWTDSSGFQDVARAVGGIQG